MKITRFKCVVCGRLTAGRLPRGGRHRPGDTSAYYPRRHKHHGKPCAGNILQARWVDVETDPANM